jgi:hypothetical protein
MLLHPAASKCLPMITENFEIRVKGRLGRRALSSLDDFVAESEPAETVLRGTVEDQSALHGLLDQIQDLGLELIEVRRIDDRVEGGDVRAPSGAHT